MPTAPKDVNIVLGNTKREEFLQNEKMYGL